MVVGGAGCVKIQPTTEKAERADGQKETAPNGGRHQSGQGTAATK
jgi:hypothetical protein